VALLGIPARTVAHRGGLARIVAPYPVIYGKDQTKRCSAGPWNRSAVVRLGARVWRGRWSVEALKGRRRDAETPGFAPRQRVY